MGKKSLTVELDVIDKAMLRFLQDDGALSNATLGEKLSLSVTPCWRRRKRLEDEGVITGYQANVNRRTLGMDVFAFALVTFNMHSDKAADNFEAVIKNRAEDWPATRSREARTICFRWSRPIWTRTASLWSEC